MVYQKPGIDDLQNSRSKNMRRYATMISDFRLVTSRK